MHKSSSALSSVKIIIFLVPNGTGNSIIPGFQSKAVNSMSLTEFLIQIATVVKFVPAIFS